MDRRLIEECWGILQEIDEKIGKNREIIDLFNENVRKKVFNTILILVEIYHMIKFMKEEGIFEEGKWWKGSEEDYLAKMRRKLEKTLENLIENVPFYLQKKKR